VENKCLDVIDCLMDDHESLKNVISRLQNDEIDCRRKKTIFKRFLPLLESHTFAEEHAVMERVLQHEPTRMQALRGMEEHELSGIQLKRLMLAATEEQWVARLKLYCSLLERHIEEDARKAFPLIQMEFSTEEREELGRRYLEARNRYQLGPVLSMPVRSELAQERAS